MDFLNPEQKVTNNTLINSLRGSNKHDYQLIINI